MLEESELGLIREMSKSPYGIVIVVGPTGSGKSTTLYSMLSELNSPGVNISTVEDPVEYTLDGIHQVQVIREKGLDFSRALRSLMRQDPDIILVGETRDKETAQAAMEAAMEMGPLRALVNGAGIGSASRTVDRNGDPMPLAQFEFVIRVNLIGTFNCIRLGAASMAKTDPLDSDGQRGAIVNMASVAAFDGQTGQNAYSASKGGVVGMTLPIARDLVPLGIRINTIAPGLIDTPI